MRVGCRSVALAATLAVLVFGGSAQAAGTPNKCASGKTKLAGKSVAALLKCYAKAASKAAGAGDALITAPCVSKVRSKFVLGSQKLDAKQKLLVPGDPSICPHAEDLVAPGDDPEVLADINAHVKDLANDLDPGFPTFATVAVGKGSSCTAGKMKCVAKLEAGLLGCYAKALGAGATIDPLCVSKVQGKFSGGGVGCMDKLQTKEVPAKVPPTNVCTAPDGDAPALLAKVQRWDHHNQSFYGQAASANTPACATLITFAGTSTDPVLDSGWTGFAHDASVVTDGSVSVQVATCAGDGSAPACGVCNYVGPVENPTGELQMFRCTTDSSKKCEFDSDCSGGGKCRAFFGTYLPLTAAGVSSCVGTYFNSSLTGTADLTPTTGGTSTGLAKAISLVYSQITLAQPCPQCNGDTTANDGNPQGTCLGGDRNALSCDANGSSPHAAFGTTSLDCPPSSGNNIGTLPINLDNTTGTKTVTISGSNALCKGSGWNTGTECGGGPCRCQCNTCDNPFATPCSTDAECGAKYCGGGPNVFASCTDSSECPSSTCEGGGTCGGKRCVIPGQVVPNGMPCTSNPECPGGGCVTPGEPTRGNKCDGGPGDCNLSTGICTTGLAFFCSNETFRSCTNSGQCTGGGTCTVTGFHKCYDNGLVGDSVSADGNADASAPGDHFADPTLAALFCIGPTTSSALNTAAGLPGLGRLELTGHSTDNGTL